jgi:hypothetical protein
MQRDKLTEANRDRRRAFGIYLRTGRIVARPEGHGLQVKFNPWHDPADGRFTFTGQGTYFNQGEVRENRDKATQRRGRRSSDISSASSSVDRSDAFRPTGRNSGKVIPAVPYLSSLHNEVLQLASQHPQQIGTNEWTSDDLVRWKLGRENIFDFKKQWVRGYRDAINAAAKRFDLPPELVAGVAFNEVGGDPLEIDNLAYSLRSGPSRDKTSFGNVSIQVRRAAEALGYDLRYDLTESQRRMIITSLEQPQINIFVAAKHLSDLRDMDFKNIAASQMTKQQAEIIATRYNRGPDLTVSQIQQNLSYGRALTKRWGVLKSLLH